MSKKRTVKKNFSDYDVGNVRYNNKGQAYTPFEYTLPSKTYPVGTKWMKLAGERTKRGGRVIRLDSNVDRNSVFAKPSSNAGFIRRAITSIPFVKKARNYIQRVTSNEVVGNLLESVVRTQLGNVLPIKTGTTKTEYDVSEYLTDNIDKQVRYKAKQLGITDRSFKSNKDTIRASFRGTKDINKMYGRDYGTSQGIFDKTFRQNQAAENVLGSYNIKYYKDGYQVTDDYDFNHDASNYKEDNWYTRFRKAAYKYAGRPETPRSNIIRFDVKRHVNHWGR